MAKPADAIMPILKRIQADVGDVRRKVVTAIAEVKGVSERMDAFEDYFTYTMGLTQQNKADIKRIGAQIKSLQAKVNGKDRRS
jgi:NADH:ubiquinone oxidoreductase subunit E